MRHSEGSKARPARTYLPADLIDVATGEPLSAKPYLDHLNQKYGELYGL